MARTSQGHHHGLNPSPVPAASHPNPEPAVPNSTMGPPPPISGLGDEIPGAGETGPQRQMAGGCVFLRSCFFRLCTCHNLSEAFP